MLRMSTFGGNVVAIISASAASATFDNDNVEYACTYLLTQHKNKQKTWTYCLLVLAYTIVRYNYIQIIFMPAYAGCHIFIQFIIYNYCLLL